MISAKSVLSRLTSQSRLGGARPALKINPLVKPFWGVNHTFAKG